MKKLLLTALLVSFAFTGIAVVEEDSQDTNTSNPTTEEIYEGEYDVMPAQKCDPVDCWGI